MPVKAIQQPAGSYSAVAARSSPPVSNTYTLTKLYAVSTMLVHHSWLLAFELWSGSPVVTPSIVFLLLTILAGCLLHRTGAQTTAPGRRLVRSAKAVPKVFPFRFGLTSRRCICGLFVLSFDEAVESLSRTLSTCGNALACSSDPRPRLSSKI